MAARLTLRTNSRAAGMAQRTSALRLRGSSHMAAARPALRKPLANPKPTLAQPAMAAAGGLEEGSREDLDGEFDSALRVPTTMKGLGSGGAGGMGATMERSKLDMSQKQVQTTPQLSNDGGGGNNGGKIFNGGGGGDDGGDDDDYFDDFDGEEGDGDGDGFFRVVLPELYDQITLNAVMAEWFRSVADLPLILRQAVSMGLFSSAQLVRFLSMDVRPGVARAVSRSTSPGFSREFIGRLMADPAFAQKLVIEQFITASGSVFYEWRHRGENFSKELDFVLANTLTLCVANAALVWSVAPNRSYGSSSKLPWQSMLSGLPNNVFDASGPLRTYTNTSRAAGFFAKAAELSAVGAAAGAAQAGIGHGLVALRRATGKDSRFEPSVPVPSVTQSALGLGAFMGLSSNFRYQLLGGADRYLFDHSQFLWSYLAVSSTLRAASQYVGNGTRLVWQGLPTQVTPKRRTRTVRRTVKRKSSASSRPATSGGFQMSASTASPTAA